MLGPHNADKLPSLNGTFEAFERKKGKELVKHPDLFFAVPIKDGPAYRFGTAKEKFIVHVKRLHKAHYLWQFAKESAAEQDESHYILLLMRRDSDGFTALAPVSKGREIEDLAERHSVSLKYGKLSGSANNILAFLVAQSTLEMETAMVWQAVK